MSNEQLHSEISQIREILARQEECLKEHMRRTALLEDIVKPIQRRVYMIEGVLYFIGSLGIGSSLAFILSKLWHS